MTPGPSGGEASRQHAHTHTGAYHHGSSMFCWEMRSSIATCTVTEDTTTSQYRSAHQQAEEGFNF